METLHRFRCDRAAMGHETVREAPEPHQGSGAGDEGA